MDNKMKSILVIGRSSAGKSTTMKAVCEKLNPSKVYILNPNKDNLDTGTILDVEKIFNGTFVIEVNGKFVLVVVGSPTEQKITITILIEYCIKIKINLSFLLVSMRTSERTTGFNTRTELAKLSDIILVEKIKRIEGDDFKNGVEWNNRINKITELVKSNI